MYDVRLPNSHAGGSGWTAYVARRVKTADGRKIAFSLRAKAVLCPIPLRALGDFHGLAQSSMVCRLAGLLPLFVGNAWEMG